MEGTTHKLSALALQNRHLVVTSKKGGCWSAAITEAGRHYLAHGNYPVHRAVRNRLAGGASARVSTPRAEAIPPVVLLTPKVTKAATPPTVRLIEDVIAAGGALQVDRREGRTNYEMLVSSAIRFGKVPPGKLLVIHQGRRWENLTIRLWDMPDSCVNEATVLVVPASLRGAHRIVTALRESNRLPIMDPCRKRALRLLQGLIVEAEARGYVVILADEPSPGQRSRSDRALLTVGIKGHKFGLRFRQEMECTPHIATRAELSEKERHSWHRIPSHDERPSERLSIHVTNGHEYRQSTWKDGKRNSLDDSLGEILREVELRAVFAEDTHLARERAQAKHQLKWERAMARAKVDLREASRADRLLGQAKSWRRNNLLREYVAAMETAVARTGHADEQSSARAWISWSTNHVDRNDPFSTLPQMPDDPEPTAEALEPFLRGWSLYGPGAVFGIWE
jgi:hypothetical protein